jgi:hypothetical protein
MCTHSHPAVWRKTPSDVLSARATAVVGDPGDPGASATLDLSQSLDVDVDQLPRPLTLIAHDGLSD